MKNKNKTMIVSKIYRLVIQLCFETHREEVKCTGKKAYNKKLRFGLTCRSKFTKKITGNQKFKIIIKKKIEKN